MGGYLRGADLTVLIVYFLAVLAVGLYFYRSGQSRTTAGFTTAGRALPGWTVGLSILATYLSSISFLALPGRSYAEDWNTIGPAAKCRRTAISSSVSDPDHPAGRVARQP